MKFDDMLLENQDPEQLLAIWNNDKNCFDVCRTGFVVVYNLNISNPDEYRKVYRLDELKELSIGKLENEFKKTLVPVEHYGPQIVKETEKPKKEYQD